MTSFAHFTPVRTFIWDRPEVQWTWNTTTPSLERILKFCYACGITLMHSMANPCATRERALVAREKCLEGETQTMKKNRTLLTW